MFFLLSRSGIKSSYLLMQCGPMVFARLEPGIGINLRSLVASSETTSEFPPKDGYSVTFDLEDAF